MWRVQDLGARVLRRACRLLAGGLYDTAVRHLPCQLPWAWGFKHPDSVVITFLGCPSCLLQTPEPSTRVS